MNTDTPRTNEALAAILDKDGYLSEDNAPDVLVKLCRTMERERDEAIQARKDSAADWLNQVRNADLRVTMAKRERDEARGGSWFLNGAEYRKRSGDIEARNNLNPHWVVVDSQTNQKP
jgi:hypothetical protein